MLTIHDHWICCNYIKIFQNVCTKEVLLLIRQQYKWREVISPGAILPSCAAGPSFSTFFTCRNSSGLSPPIIVNPNPIVLFFKDVRIRAPNNWDGSRVKIDFTDSAHKEEYISNTFSCLLIVSVAVMHCLTRSTWLEKSQKETEYRDTTKTLDKSWLSKENIEQIILYK